MTTLKQEVLAVIDTTIDLRKEHIALKHHGEAKASAPDFYLKDEVLVNLYVLRQRLILRNRL